MLADCTKPQILSQALKGKSLSKKMKKPVLVPQPEADYHRDYYSVFDAADGDIKEGTIF